MPLAVEYYLSSSTWIAREKACVRQLTFDSAAVTESRGENPARSLSRGLLLSRGQRGDAWNFRHVYELTSDCHRLICKDAGQMYVD